MLPRITRYHRPDTAEAALALLNDPGAAPLAGGTHLLATPNRQVEQVVDLQALGWRRIEVTPGWLRLGSLVTLAELAEAADLDNPAGALLRQAAWRAGPNTYRNAATLGGLIGARPAVSELVAALMALGAQVELAGEQAEPVALEAYLAAPRGLVAAVRLPWPHAGAGASEAIGRTPADAPIVHVTVWAGAAGVRIAAGGVAPGVVRLPAAEQAVAADRSASEAAVSAAMAAVEPPGDFRGSPEYRRAMLGVLLRRALAACAGEE